MNRRLFLQLVTAGLLTAGISTTAEEKAKIGDLRIEADGGKVIVSNLGKTFTIGTIEVTPLKKPSPSGTLTVEFKMKLSDSELDNLSRHLKSAGFTSVKFSSK